MQPVQYAPRPHPKGSVLMFALVIMLLMGLAGTAIFMNTRNEMVISDSVNSSRNAFAGTDAAAQIATAMGRVVLSPELPLSDFLAGNANATGSDPRHPLKVVVNDAKFNQAALAEAGAYDYGQRYLEAASWDGRTANGNDLSPHLVFTTPVQGASGGNVDATVATASFSMAVVNPLSSQNAGGSRGQPGYDSTGGSGRTQVYMTVTVNGRPLDAAAPAPAEAAAFDGGSGEGPYSIITTIFRELK